MRTICYALLNVLIGACSVLAMTVQTPDSKNDRRTPYRPKPGDFVVVCTLFEGRPPGATDSTPTEPITYDPRFKIGARVERVTLGESPWRVGEAVTFVIHSPTLTLGNSFTGKQFALTLSPFRPTTEVDKVWFRPETRYLLQWVTPAKAAEK